MNRQHFPCETNFLTMTANACFQENLRTANVRAETFTELQVMHAEDFRALAEVFPEFKVCLFPIFPLAFSLREKTLPPAKR